MRIAAICFGYRVPAGVHTNSHPRIGQDVQERAGFFPACADGVIIDRTDRSNAIPVQVETGVKTWAIDSRRLNRRDGLLRLLWQACEEKGQAIGSISVDIRSMCRAADRGGCIRPGARFPVRWRIRRRVLPGKIRRPVPHVPCLRHDLVARYDRCGSESAFWVCAAARFIGCGRPGPGLGLAWCRCRDAGILHPRDGTVRAIGSSIGAAVSSCFSVGMCLQGGHVSAGRAGREQGGAGRCARAGPLVTP